LNRNQKLASYICELVLRFSSENRCRTFHSIFNFRQMDSPTTVRRPSFATAYPKGVQLSESTVAVMEKMRKKRTAITFDEITLEDKPSDLHPNDVSLKSFVTRKIALKVRNLQTMISTFQNNLKNFRSDPVFQRIFYREPVY
jgi:hypothetical protein